MAPISLALFSPQAVAFRFSVYIEHLPAQEAGPSQQEIQGGRPARSSLASTGGD